VTIEAEVKERFEDFILPVLKMGKGATSQRMQAVSETWKRVE
jgi:hypothetical protein